VKYKQGIERPADDSEGVFTLPVSVIVSLQW